MSVRACTQCPRGLICAVLACWWSRWTPGCNTLELHNHERGCGSMQWWRGLRSSLKEGQHNLAVQLDTTVGAVLPAGPLSQLLVFPGGPASPADLCNSKNKALLAAAEDAVKGAKVRRATTSGVLCPFMPGRMPYEMASMVPRTRVLPPTRCSLKGGT